MALDRLTRRAAPHSKRGRRRELVRPARLRRRRQRHLRRHLWMLFQVCAVHGHARCARLLDCGQAR